jgi:murein DD-endopeptidase MepM/ murein hydrolase activator NlpD
LLVDLANWLSQMPEQLVWRPVSSEGHGVRREGAVRTAQRLIARKARAVYTGMALVLMLGTSLSGYAPRVAAADIEKYDHIILAQDTPLYAEIGGEVKWDLPAGDEVVVLTGQKDGFYRIAWGKQRGYARAEDLAAGTDTSSADEELPKDTFKPADGSTDNVIVAHSGDGVHFRDEAGYDGKVIDTLPDGTVVQLRLDKVDTVTDDTGATWWPVSFDGNDGWIAGYYLSEESDVAADDNTDAATSAADDSAARFVAGDFVAVETDDGSGINIRADASGDGEKIGTLAEGEVVEVLAGPASDDTGDGWYKITDGDITGYVTGKWLVAAPQPETPAGQQASGEKDAVKFAAGDHVAAHSGDGVNLRKKANPSAKVVDTLVEGEVVLVVDGPTYDDTGNGWYLVDDGNVRGYADGDILIAVPEDEVPASAPSAAVVQDPIKFAAGDYAAAHTDDGGGVNIRKDAGKNAARIGTLSEGETVQILDAKYDKSGNDWYLIDTGDVRGYAVGNLLVAASPPKTTGPTGTFHYPLASYQFTQAYGCSPYAIEPWNAALGCNFHNGVDLAAPMYTPIMASDGGTVVFSSWCDCGLGWYVEIDHHNGYSTVYGHMAEQPWVSVGQDVNQGDVIGPIGSSGASTGPHTHFMVKLNGSTIDPMTVLG